MRNTLIIIETSLWYLKDETGRRENTEGNFHCVLCDSEDGCIMRSLKFDRRERFKLGDTYYTSIIGNARKP